MKNYDKDRYTSINSETWDKWAENGCEWTIPVTHEEFLSAKESGKVSVYLTPCVTVPDEWFGNLRGKRLLGLASGGAQQMPLFAAAGTVCTVFDFSDSQLEKEKIMSEREGYAIDIVKGDMSKPLPFPDGSFDIIFHPVSNCYVKDVRHIWRECARLLVPGGRLLRRHAERTADTEEPSPVRPSRNGRQRVLPYARQRRGDTVLPFDGGADRRTARRRALSEGSL